MDSLITIKIYNDYFIAGIAKSKLDDVGIPCVLKNEHSGTVLPSIIIGGIRLCVPEEFSMEAIKVLESENEEIIDAFMEEDRATLNPDNRLCIFCNSKNTTTTNAAKKTFLGKKLFNIWPALFDKDRWHCFNCGKDF